LRPHFKAGLINGQLEELLANRKQITIAEYETIFDNQLSGPLDRQLDTQQDTAKFVLSGLKNEQRQYICH
jgi:hydroxymethylglutaryl-CoA synthase